MGSYSTGVTRYTSRVAPPAKDRPVTLIYGRGTMSFAEAVRSLDISTVIARYGDWVVTTYGLECLATYYPIPVDRLWSEWTLRHMSTKGWIVYADFAAAYEAARAQHGRKAPIATRQPVAKASGRVAKTRRRSSLRLRFLVMKRDGFKCQLCGGTGERVTLEVDHKVSLANGGSNDVVNLWTLCQPCNRGKRTDNL